MRWPPTSADLQSVVEAASAAAQMATSAATGVGALVDEIERLQSGVERLAAPDNNMTASDMRSYARQLLGEPQAPR